MPIALRFDVISLRKETRNDKTCSSLSLLLPLPRLDSKSDRVEGTRGSFSSSSTFGPFLFYGTTVQLVFR